MRYSSRFKSKSGFSLVECIIAIAVFAVLSALVAMLLSNSLTTHRDNMSETRSLRGQRLAHVERADIGERGNHPPTVRFNFGGGSGGVNEVRYNFEAFVAEEAVYLRADALRRGLELNSMQAPAGSTSGSRASQKNPIVAHYPGGIAVDPFLNPPADSVPAVGSPGWGAPQNPTSNSDGSRFNITGGNFTFCVKCVTAPVPVFGCSCPIVSAENPSPLVGYVLRVEIKGLTGSGTNALDAVPFLGSVNNPLLELNIFSLFNAIGDVVCVENDFLGIVAPKVTAPIPSDPPIDLVRLRYVMCDAREAVPPNPIAVANCTNPSTGAMDCKCPDTPRATIALHQKESSSSPGRNESLTWDFGVVLRRPLPDNNLRLWLGLCKCDRQAVDAAARICRSCCPLCMIGDEASCPDRNTHPR
jgi:prepilin-type N-terminal cleavage/methylation domain-containing protein